MMQCALDGAHVPATVSKPKGGEDPIEILFSATTFYGDSGVLATLRLHTCAYCGALFAPRVKPREGVPG